ncbi:uncharacterized protein LOC101745488 isoform X1 [Bombyx mori]|uniref:Uncharacterized protein n=1 Tax=Bombyx mori TaxID=7091 RepID=A0A8R2HNE4_BOMMO|nr:uncharacterized protein LOC101745488 isoform X1 [Bombyx mori]
MAKQDDGLFLLEVLVDKIVFAKSPCFSDKDFRTCVNIECPSVEPLEICDDDPGACVVKSGGPFVKTFNSGKSCLFSLKEADINKAMSKFPIKVTVYKSLPCGCLPTKIVMGEATIDMTKEFVQARKKFLEDPSNVSYEALKDAFRIVGSDGVEAGEIIMFLRISCFGKLIITRFQGAGPPNLSSAGNSSVVDRSCNPRKDFQTTQDPCACGTANAFKKKGITELAACPEEKDHYNSMPCEDPDDPCYCSGPKTATKQQMACRNTDQYCLHVPKGTGSSRLSKIICKDNKKDKEFENSNRRNDTGSKIRNFYPENKNNIYDVLPLLSNERYTSEDSEVSLSTSISNSRIDSARDNLFSKLYSRYSSKLLMTSSKVNPFNVNETTVFMTLLDNSKIRRTSGSQATASINKCLQASKENNSERIYGASTLSSSSNNWSTCTLSTCPHRNFRQGNNHDADVYFFGNKKENKLNVGMGSSDSKSNRKNSGQHAPIKGEKNSNVKNTAGVQAQSQSNTAAAQTGKCKGSSATTSTCKAVSIKDEKSENVCPAVSGTKGDMVATVSHIKIGPREPCPVHGREPCQGPKCIIASSGEDHVPVKVTTVTNPRRGVFELVVRKMTGAPLAKNELMLEWTPPPYRQPPCGTPCLIPCTTPGRVPKCKMIVCRPSRCKTKSCKGPKRPCGPISCRSPSKKCIKTYCCLTTCRPCKPCPIIPRCRSPSPCKSPRVCCSTLCSTPCKSTPCLRSCPVGRKKTRRAKSQPRIRAHKKRMSPCLNRISACPVVRCRSIPGPCIACCPIPCPIRKCCSGSPFKPPKCCRSTCSSC